MREAAASGRHSSESLPGKENSWGASVSRNYNYGTKDHNTSRPLFWNGRPQAEPGLSPELRCRGPGAGEGGTLSSARVPQSRWPLALPFPSAQVPAAAQLTPPRPPSAVGFASLSAYSSRLGRTSDPSYADSGHLTQNLLSPRDFRPQPEKVGPLCCSPGPRRRL